MDEINVGLLKLEAKLQRKKKLQKRLFHTKQALKKEQGRLADLEKKLEKEGDDIKKLEGLSLSALFRALLGSKERQAQIERREYLEVKLQRDEAAYSVSEKKRDMGQIEAELAGMSDVEEEYYSLLSQKEKMILTSNPNSANELYQLMKNAGSIRAQQMEIIEAIHAGEAVRDALDGLIKSLQRAGDWGVWDILGGGLLVNGKKHNHMDAARDQLHQVQQLISQFRRELGDIEQIASGANIQLGEFERFADLFFDGLIVDWMVQAKIEKSLESAIEARVKIEEILSYLETHQLNLGSQVERLEANRQRIIRKV